MITNVQTVNMGGSGVEILWNDSATDAVFYELWVSVSAGAYSLAATVAGSLRSYLDASHSFATATYKVRKLTSWGSTSPFDYNSVDIITAVAGKVSSIVTQNSSYNAFPSLIVLPNGNFMMEYSKQALHSPDTQAKSVYKISTDKGVTWGSEVELAPNVSAHTRYDSYLSKVGNRVFFVYNQYNYYGTNGQYIYLRYSDDNCATWSSDIQITSTYLNGTYVYQHGDIIADPSGNLLMCLWGQHGTDTYDKVAILKSTDNGLTWSDLSWIDNRLKDTYYQDVNANGEPGCLSEPSIIYAPNGNLLLFPRGNGLIYTSLDNGATWDNGVSLGMDFGSPRFLVDGSTLYLFGRLRNLSKGYNGNCYPADILTNNIGYIKSPDSGITWSAPYITDTYGSWMEGDGGYGGVIAHDGKISVCYHTNDGYNSDLGVSSDNQPYIRYIDNIKYDINFGDPTKTNIQITHPSSLCTGLKVWGKVGSGAYSYLGSSPGNIFNYLSSTGITMTYKSQAQINGVWTDYGPEVSLFIYDVRATKIFQNVAVQGESLTTARKLNIHNTIVALKAANLFDTQFDAIVISRNTGVKTTKMNLINDSFNLAPNANGGTLTQTDDVGYHSDGTNSFLNTQLLTSRLKLGRVKGTPASNISWGFKISGTINTTSTAGHGMNGTGNIAGIFAAYLGGGNKVGLSSDGISYAGTRVAGYNCLARNSENSFNLYQNASSVTINDTSEPDMAFEIFLLAVNNYGNKYAFTGAGEILEISWIGKYLTQAQFLTFKGILDTYIANL